MDVVWGDQEPNAAASGNPAQAGEDMRHSRAAKAQALLAAIQREPSKPPASGIPAVRMQDVEADHAAIGFDGEHRVCQATAYGRDNVLQGTKEAFDMVGVEFDGVDDAKVGAIKPFIDEGRIRPEGGHDSPGVGGMT